MVLTVLLGILAATFVAYSVLKYSEKITNTATITGYELQLWRVDSNARVTAISWSSLDQGASKTSDTAFGFTQKLTVKNVGDYNIRVAWKLNTTMPNGETLTAQYASSEGSPWSSWPQNDYTYLGSTISPNEVSSRRIQWILTIPEGAPRGAITFDILLLADSVA